MMRRTRVTIVAAAMVALSAGIGGAALARTMNYFATATGDQEAPTPVESDAEAKLRVTVHHDGERVDFDLKVTEPIDDVLMAHLHSGVVGQAGGIAVWLYPAAPPPELIPGSFEGRLAKGTFGPDALCVPATNVYCVDGVPDWDAFLADLDAGAIYVNLHTSDNPGGEVRGQVLGR